MIREFKLTNSSGVEYNLTERKSFLYDIGGLGFSESTDYQNIGNHYKPLRRKYQQWAPEGTIIFCDWDTCYAEYHRFALFCQDSPLVLSYFQHNTTYYMQVLVSSLNKTEIGERDALECNIKFAALSPWYEVLSAERRQIETGGSKTYDYAYEVNEERPDGGYIYGNDHGMSVTMVSPSRLKSPMRIGIHGPVLNPSWVLTCDGKTIGSGRVIASVDAAHMLVVDNTTPDFLIQIVDESGTEIVDAYQLSDFDTDRFVYLQYGTNTLSVSHEGTEDVTVEVTAHVEYETV